MTIAAVKEVPFIDDITDADVLCAHPGTPIHMKCLETQQWKTHMQKNTLKHFRCTAK